MKKILTLITALVFTASTVSAIEYSRDNNGITCTVDLKHEILGGHLPYWLSRISEEDLKIFNKKHAWNANISDWSQHKYCMILILNRLGTITEEFLYPEELGVTQVVEASLAVITLDNGTESTISLTGVVPGTLTLTASNGFGDNDITDFISDEVNDDNVFHFMPSEYNFFNIREITDNVVTFRATRKW